MLPQDEEILFKSLCLRGMITPMVEGISFRLINVYANMVVITVLQSVFELVKKLMGSVNVVTVSCVLVAIVSLPVFVQDYLGFHHPQRRFFFFFKT